MGSPIKVYPQTDSSPTEALEVTGTETGSKVGLDVSIVGTTVPMGDVQYTEGDTDASIMGTAILWEDSADTLRPVSAAKPLPVDIVSGASSGTQYTEGDTDTSITGTAAMAEGNGNTLLPLKVNSSQQLLTSLESINGNAVPTGNGASTNSMRVAIANDTDWKPHIQDSAGNNINLGNQLMANSLPVTIASNQTAVPVSGTVTANAGSGTYSTKEVRSATGTTSSVSGSATNVTLLASNANRLGASVVNDSSAILYLKCGTTATSSDFTVKLYQDDYWEAPYGYTGRIDAIWASATGAARITEFT